MAYYFITWSYKENGKDMVARSVRNHKNAGEAWKKILEEFDLKNLTTGESKHLIEDFRKIE